MEEKWGGGGEVKGASVVYYVNIHIHILFAQSKSKFQRDSEREIIIILCGSYLSFSSSSIYCKRLLQKSNTEEKIYEKRNGKKNIKRKFVKIVYVCKIVVTN